MITIVLMAVFTLGVLFFLAQAAMADRSAAAEIVLCRAWSYRFARQTLVEQKEEYIDKNNKYHHGGRIRRLRPLWVCAL